VRTAVLGAGYWQAPSSFPAVLKGTQLLLGHWAFDVQISTAPLGQTAMHWVPAICLA
jgi:hypothetical protein